MAKKKRKGRPPKFVLDENGKEVYGLSYNNSTNMYYATFSDPRVYFSAGGKSQNRLQNAIAKYRAWAKTQKLTPEQQNQEAELVRTYEKARQLLLKDEYLQDEIAKKAKQLLEEAENDNSSEGYGRFNELVDMKAKSLVENGERDDYFMENIDRLFWKNDLYLRIIEWIKKPFNRGGLNEFREYLWDIIHDELLRNPIKIAKATKIPQLAFIKKQVDENSISQSMSWEMAWQIFREHKPFEEYRFDKTWYAIIEKKLSHHLGKLSLKQVGHESLYKALTSKIRCDYFIGKYFGKKSGEKAAKTIMDQFDCIPMEDRLELLEEVFLTIKEAGYHQADNALRHLRGLYDTLCQQR